MARFMDIFKEDFSTSKPGDMKNPMGMKQITAGFLPVTKKPQPLYSLAEATPDQKVAEYEEMIGGPYRDKPTTGYEDAW